MSQSQQPTPKHKIEDEETEAQKIAFLSAINVSGHFLLTRYPYLCAVLLMVSMPEEIKDESKPLPDFRLVYIQLGFYFVVGTVMSFNLFGCNRFAALLMAMNSVVEAYAEYDYSTKEDIKARLLFRKFVVVGCYFMVAGGLELDNEDDETEDNKNINQKLLKFGRQLIGTYIVLLGIFMIHNRNEFSAHAQILPGGVILSWLLAIFYIICGILIDYGCLVVKCSKITMFVLFFVTLIVDTDSSVWVDKAGIHKWKMFSIAAHHIPLVSVLMMIREGFY